ncbi:methyl-accepting chemotaxis sensory transducer [Gloeothece citriformis PCC 7424]|uniref:Methyl-accepting chemotaxis sensory transducer n=1 Tax=Gloeothece citriformis (strain PCC 7424) TaxID=65393 RepID=B7KBI7_GLOC7|nr:methyl-accepting chemotaxis protein [Gloeothece citriformis]ACK72965.1 methyl-accepting chemotaxis sensory transducer [Gloeothece citriformis PCC 7424]
MTNYQKYIASTPDAKDNELFSDSSGEKDSQKTDPPNLSKPNLIQSFFNFEVIGKNTLSRRLLLTVLPTVLVPLTVASLIGFSIIRQKAQNQTLSQLEYHVDLSRNVVEEFLDDGFVLTDLVVTNPTVINDLRSKNNNPDVQKLSVLPIESLEKTFAQTKLLNANPDLNTYLEKLTQTNRLAEIFITNSYGFNTAYSNPTTDFVQRDEKWWQTAKQQGSSIDNPEYDESAQETVIAFAEAIKDPSTGNFLGVIKTGILASELNNRLTSQISGNLLNSEQIQIISAGAGVPLTTLTAQITNSDSQSIIGGENVLNFIRAFYQLAGTTENEINPQKIKELEQQNGLSNLTLELLDNKETNSKTLLAQFEYQGKIFNLSTISVADWVAISSVNQSEIALAGQELLFVFAITALILGGLSVALIFILARQLSNPLTNLTSKAQQVAKGNLEVQAELEGTVEVQTLADSFNNLVSKVKTLLNQQILATEEQRQQRENIEQAIFQLVEEIEAAAEGDLTVRASLSSLELSTVADLFNLIIESLKDIAIEVKQSTNQVSTSLETNEISIRQLAEQSIEEAEEIQQALQTIQNMTDSIEEVATNAGQAAESSEQAYSEVQQGSQAMETTVESIINLRNTISETAQKMKQLGESSQRISQVVAIIEEIALKTNLLAINASVEARRAGEQGQGFTVVAEQVGALAEQSSAATKEIARIVAAIQSETQEVATQMEAGTVQVVDTSRLVKTTQDYLNQASQQSQEIYRLMQSISQATVSQTATSQIVSQLMERVSQSAQEKAVYSRQIAEEINATTAVAKELESKVDQFRVDK